MSAPLQWLAQWWAGRHERRRQEVVLADLAAWYLWRNDDDNVARAYADARRDLRLQELGVPDTDGPSNFRDDANGGAR